MTAAIPNDTTRWPSPAEAATHGRGRRAAAAGAAVVAVPLAWAAYSALAVDHRVPLPPAIDAERRVMRTARGGLVSYYADDRHDGDATPIVLLHSVNAAASAYEMGPLFEALRGRRPVYAPDLPGFGFSERSDRDYTPELYAAAIADFLAGVAPNDGVPNGGCDVVALSLAAEFAAMVAVREPERVRSLALVAPTGLAARNARTSGGQQRGREGGAGTAFRLLSSRFVGQPLFDALVTRPSIRFFLGRSFGGAVDQTMVEYDYATAHQAGARFAPLAFVSGRLFTRDVLHRYYAAVRAPGLVLHDDAPYGGFGALPALTVHANWRGERIEGTRGLPQFERPRETLAALERFWVGAPHPADGDAR